MNATPEQIREPIGEADAAAWRADVAAGATTLGLEDWIQVMELRAQQAREEAARLSALPADVERIRNALSGAEEQLQALDPADGMIVEDVLADIAAAFGELSKLVDERDAAMRIAAAAQQPDPLA